MKKPLLFTLLMVISTGAIAQDGYYEPVPYYYGNDPFVFCTVGAPQDGGAPMAQSSAP